MSPLGKTTDLLEELRSLDLTVLANDSNERNKALALSRKLTASLENPTERALDYIYKPFATIALSMAVGLRLFEYIATTEGAVSTAELSKLSGGEEALITRTLRAVAAVDFVKQTGPYEWLANEATHVMAKPSIAAGYRIEILTQSAMSSRKFLESTGWKNPSEPRNSLFGYANNTKLHLFEFFATQPALSADFNTFMGGVTGLGSWTDWYDAETRLLEGFDAKQGDVVLVDVGGGNGHETQKFCERFGAKLLGTLILQDLPDVLEGIQEDSLNSKITTMAYDFFEPQPIKGARAYFLQHILHDWSDKYCLVILKHLRDAMIPGYSKLIIHDIVLPDVGASEGHARFDLAMMAINSGMERSAREFTQLLESAGFKVTSTWSWPDKDGIVEAEVAA